MSNKPKCMKSKGLKIGTYNQEGIIKTISPKIYAIPKGENFIMYVEGAASMEITKDTIPSFFNVAYKTPDGTGFVIDNWEVEAQSLVLDVAVKCFGRNYRFLNSKVEDNNKVVLYTNLPFQTYLKECCL